MILYCYSCVTDDVAGEHCGVKAILQLAGA